MEGKRSAVSSKTKQYSWADGVSFTLGRTSSEICSTPAVESENKKYAGDKELQA